MITGNTILTGLLGSPVKHSRSPLMHNKAFEILDLDYRYLCFEVNEDNLETAVEGLRTLGARGFNLTMPNKSKMCSLCDRLDVGAKICGAVNTVVNDNGILTGYTTDGVGFMKAAEDAGHPLPGKKIVMLGAGGAASAVIVQAALDGVESIDIFCRKGPSYERAERIAGELREIYSGAVNEEISGDLSENNPADTADGDNRKNCQISVGNIADEDSLMDSIKKADVLINGTSVGMIPDTDKCVIRDELFGDREVFNETLTVSDLIYEPAQTKLLRLSEEAGCKTFNGMYMLLYQGAESFRLWTGQEMPAEEIKRLYFSPQA